MELYVGLDVSLKETSICVVDGSGEIVCEGAVLSEPEAIAEFVKTEAPQAKRIGLETGPTSTWLWHELRALGLPVICIDARHAKAALSMQINKSDRNDAAGLARIMQCGWYREVLVKRLSCHEVRAALNSRAMLVKIKRDLENQIRGVALSRWQMSLSTSLGLPRINGAVAVVVISAAGFASMGKASNSGATAIRLLAMKSPRPVKKPISKKPHSPRLTIFSATSITRPPS